MFERILEFPLSLTDFESRLQRRNECITTPEQKNSTNINVIPAEISFANWPSNFTVQCWNCDLVNKTSEVWFIPYVFCDEAKTRFRPRGCFCHLPCLYEYFKVHKRSNATIESHIRHMIIKRRGRAPTKIIYPPSRHTTIARYKGGGTKTDDEYRAILKQIEHDMFF
jgi:hypothetical protein